MQMSNETARLAADLSANNDTETWRPVTLDLSTQAGYKHWISLLENSSTPVVHDCIHEQLCELLAAESAQRKLDPAELEQRLQQHLDGMPIASYGRWIYYPWSHRLVHLLPEAEFKRLRFDRNRYKITPKEQARLARCTIGIVGLSVGQSAAVTLAMEGVGGTFRLADFDALSLSNLNRLRAGVYDLGVNKAVLAARQMVESDPYLDITIYPDGLSDDNIDAFMLKGGKLDLLIEECDDLYIKARLRERARALGIPVLMDTSDRGMLDVERFDLDPERPIFHNLIQSLQAESLKGLSTKDKVPFVLRLLNEQRMSTALAASLVEVGETAYTWPQLGSAVTLGGALLTDVARRLLLGTFTSSGRFYVDVETLVADGTEVEMPASAPLTPSPDEETLRPCTEIARPTVQTTGPPSPAEIRYLVAHAILAPSGGNIQPWCFEYRKGMLTCRIDTERTSSFHFLDYQQRASVLAIGAAVENMVLAAGAIGLDCQIESFPVSDDPQLVCRLRFTRRPRPWPASTQFKQIPRRVTNRRLGPRRPLGSEASELLEIALAGNGRLILITDASALEELGQLIGTTDRLQFLSKKMHRALLSELRWSPEATARTRTGIDIATLELSAADAAAMRVVALWPAMAFLKRVGGGRALERGAHKSIAAASAVGLLTMPCAGMPAFFEGGRIMERLWLAATARGLALQPYTALVYLLDRYTDGAEGYTEDERRELAQLHRRYTKIIDIPEGHVGLLLFRLAYADPPTARSLRLPVESVLEIQS